MRQLQRTDYLVAAIAGLLFAESPFTPDDTGPSIALGAVAAMLFLWYRSTREAQPLSDAAREVGAGLGRRLRDVPIALWLCLALYLAIFWPTLVFMYDRWTANFWQNNHGMAVAVMIALLARSALRRESGAPVDASLWGLPLVLVGLALAIADAAGDGVNFLAAAGFVISLPGVSLLLLGRRRTWALRLPLALCVFLVPVPNLVETHLWLRLLTTEWSADLLRFVGFNVSTHWTLLELPGHEFKVSEECSGFSTLTAAVALTLLLAYHCRSSGRRIALLAAFLPLTLIANTLRVTALVLLSIQFGTDLLDTMLHEVSGVATFFVTLGVLFVIADRPSIQDAFV